MADQQSYDCASPKTLERPRRRNRSTGNVTLADVAKIAGVSSITVSRAVHKPDLVSVATRSIVQRAVELTGYVPNMLAGGLATRQTRLVAAIVPSVANGVFVELIQGLTDRLWASGYQVLLGLSGYPSAREDELMMAVLSRRPDAICLTGIDHSVAIRQRLLAARIPIVETWDMTPTPMDMLVGFSHEQVGEAVANHLLSKQHRAFGMICADDSRALDRQRGFLSTLASHGVTTVPVIAVSAPSSLALGRTGLATLLESGVNPTAVFCSSDLVAHGALVEAQARGLTVPDDLALMGFGDLEFARHTEPPLSSVRVYPAEIGRQAAQVILDRLQGDCGSSPIIDVGFEIVDRGTS